MQEEFGSAGPVLTSDFDYALPQELIAQTPVEPRDASRLLVLDRSTGRRYHAHFSELGRYLRPGDLLVMNDSRVLAARLEGHRFPSGGRIEALLVRESSPGHWEALLRPGKRAPEGQEIRFEQQGVQIAARVESWLEDGVAVLAFADSTRPEQFGSVPLPPYIHAALADPERYQTVYAREPGSAAAPTAGLHFTPQLLDDLRAHGVETAFVTLHVGPGTFRPVQVDDARAHAMHAEFYHLDAATAATLDRAHREGRRIVAVGTTAVRVLEQIGQNLGSDGIQAGSGWTRLLILPGYRFRLVDALITNFHLPRSTLLMLVSALAGREAILDAYNEAIEQRYRFYSFGDAMLIT